MRAASTFARRFSTGPTGMLWDDPWISAATRSGPGLWNTTLPPIPAPLPADTRFCCVRWADLSAAEWISLVGTRWSAAALTERLGDDSVWIPCLRSAADDSLLATCVIRWKDGPERLWLLETLRVGAAHRGRGLGAALLRATVGWMWSPSSGEGGGPCTLAFQWDLRPWELLSVGWRGWLAAAAAIEWGWVWRPPVSVDGGCGWCPSKQITRREPMIRIPTLLRVSEDTWAIVDDSGQQDGCGLVLDWQGDVPWSSLLAVGGWQILWARAAAKPTGDGWRWSGECVVVATLNRGSATPKRLRWISAEIS